MMSLEQLNGYFNTQIFQLIHDTHWAKKWLTPKISCFSALK